MSDTRRTVSIVDVAERAGVSVATVSRIVNGNTRKASAKTVARVRRVISDLGYRPISVGRALRNRESRLVAVLAANIANPSMAAIAASTENALRGAGLTMVLCDTHDRPELQDEYLLEMRAQFARAIVLLGAIKSPKLNEFLEGDLPLVLVNRRLRGVKLPFVGIDNRAAGRQVAQYFLSRGIEDVAVVHGSPSSTATRERVAAFRKAFSEAGHPIAATRVIGREDADHLAIGADAMGRLIADGAPRAVFCLSDLIAYGAHRTVTEKGLSVPGDIELFGFDDNPLNEWIAPWLSSVRVPYDAYGDAVVAALDATREGGSLGERLLPHRLVLRAPAG